MAEGGIDLTKIETEEPEEIVVETPLDVIQEVSEPKENPEANFEAIPVVVEEKEEDDKSDNSEGSGSDDDDAEEEGKPGTISLHGMTKEEKKAHKARVKAENKEKRKHKMSKYEKNKAVGKGSGKK